jgi:hypothetical protein
VTLSDWDGADSIPGVPRLPKEDQLIREAVAVFLLYLIVGLKGINLGGNVYEMLVLTPLWTAAPPDSVVKFFKGTPFARAMQKFWLSKLAKYSLFVLAGAVIAAWSTPARRPWLIAAVAATAVIYALTIGYIFRRKKLLFRANEETPAETVRQAVRQFLTADRVRLLFKLIEFFCLVRALAIPPLK